MNTSAQVLIRPGRVAESKRWAQSGGRRVVRRPVDIVALRWETEDAITLVLRMADSKPLPFSAGQYLTLHAEVEGKSLRRAYSISSTPHSGEIAVTVKRVKDGAFSSWVMANARVGLRLHVSGPTGEFVLPQKTTSHYLFAAAGSGITPVISLIETLLHTQPTAVLRLVYGNRREQDIVFRERLDALAARHANFEVIYVLSKPGDSWQGERGHIRGELLLGDDLSVAFAECFICGPGDCVDTITQSLRSRGVASSRIHSERYVAGLKTITARPTEPHPVRFSVADKEVTVHPGESILDAGLRAGLDLPFSCTMGGCGHCKLMKSAGSVVMDEPNCLDAGEQSQGYFLACCAYPLGHVEVAA